MGIIQVIITCLMLLLSYWTLALRNNEEYRDGTMDISDTLDARRTRLVKEIRDRNANSPDEDRKDSCSMDLKETESNGVFDWTSTTVGMRRSVKCPYTDDDEELYAFRDCLPNDEHIPEWTAQNISDCPGPTLGWKMNKYVNQTKNENDTFTLDDWGQYLQEVYDITEKHPDAPVTPSDINILVLVFEDYIDYIDDITQTPAKNSRNILLLSDYAMAQMAKVPLAVGLNTARIRMFEVMTTIIKNLPVNTKLEKPTHQYILNMTTVEQSSVGPQCFGINTTDDFTDENCQVEVEVNFRKNGAQLKTLVIADNYPSMFEFHIYEPSMQVIELTPTINTSELCDGLPAPTLSVLPVPQPQSLTVLGISSSNSSTVDDPSNGDDSSSSTSNNVTNSELDSIAPRVEMKYEADNRSYVAWGPLVYITSSHVVEKVILKFKLRDRWGKEKSHLFKGTQMCGNLEESNALLDNGTSRVWDPDPCVTVTATEDYRHDTGLPEAVTCECRRTTGYFGVFVVRVGYTSEPVSTSNPPDEGLDNFMVRFEPHPAIDVTKHVLRALSFVCLLLTVATYIAFRKLRQSSSASILINLCVALIALNVVLYISGGIMHTKMGCRASSVLRYYFILVTLLWNAVEATNMYLKLVQVFGSHKSKITRKAAAVAWGLPLIPVIILLAVDKSSFDGVYDVDSKFRCLLKGHILHYALLVPIGVIMLFNFIIFGLALSVIIKLGKARTNQGKRRMWLTKLLGAVALLVLLGVPWIFSAFGAIDPEGDWKLKLVERIFQVIFVVLFNLQGIFIFLFHGVRNKEARSEWRSSVSWLSTSAGRVASQTDSQLQSSPGRTSACNQPNKNTTSTDRM